jgi:hypothetical protein
MSHKGIMQQQTSKKIQKSRWSTIQSLRNPKVTTNKLAPYQNLELFYGDWHGTWVPSGTIESKFYGPLIKEIDRFVLIYTML